jgi:hypothetical protein
MKTMRSRLTIAACSDCPTASGIARVGRASTEQREEQGVRKDSHRLTVLLKKQQNCSLIQLSLAATARLRQALLEWVGRPPSKEKSRVFERIHIDSQFC